MRNLTHNEALVGRRLPPYPKHIDTYLARYVKADSSFCGKMTPAEPWLRPAHKKARANGWIRFEGLSFGKGMEVWFLTEKGETEAAAAAARVRDAMEAREQWARVLSEILQRRHEAGPPLTPTGVTNVGLGQH
jgi:hypothetical protein